MSSNDVNEQLLWEQIALKKQSISTLKSSINDKRKDVSSKKKIVNSLLNEIETARTENTPLIDEDDKWTQISTLKSEINTLITSIKSTREIIKDKENTVEDNIDLLQDNALEGVELPPPLEKVLSVSRLQVNDNTTIAGSVKINNNLNVSGDIYFDNSANLTNLIVNNNTNLNKLVVDNSANLTNLIVTNNTNLNKLVVDNSANLSDLTVTNNTNLNKLVVDNSANLTNLIVTNNTNLNKLVVDNSANLTNLIVTNNTNLNKLVVDNSANLSDLTVTNNTNLNKLVVDNSANLSDLTVTNKFNLGNKFLLDNANNIIVKTNIIPDLSNIYTLGSLEKPFMDLFLGPSSLYINGTKVISADQAEEMKIETTINQNLTIQTSGTGVFKLQSNADMNLNTVGVNSDINFDTTGAIKINSPLGLVFAANNYIKYTDQKLYLKGDVVIDGSLNINGKQTVINTEALSIKDNIVILNSNQQLNPVVGFQSGFEVIRGNRPKYNFKFRDLGANGGVFEVGEDEDLQPVVTRKESNLMTDKGVLYWDNSNNRLDTFDNIKFNNGNLDISNNSKLLIGGVDVLSNINTSLNEKLNLTGGTLTGGLNMGGQSISNINVLSSLGLQDRNRIADRLNFISINGTTNFQEWLRFRQGGGNPAGNAGCIFSNFSSNNYFLYNNGSLRINHSSTNIDSNPTGVGADPLGSSIFSLSTSGTLNVPELQEGGVSLSSKYALIGAGDNNWTVNGNDIYNSNTGSVAIGSQAPATNVKCFIRNSTGGANIQLSGTDATNATWRIGTPSLATIAFGGNSDHTINFGYFDNANTTFTSRMVIDRNTGNVGIGTTSPDAKLEVVGDIKHSGYYHKGDVMYADLYVVGTGMNYPGNRLVYLNGTQLVNSSSRGLTLTIIDSNLELVSSTNYDTHGDVNKCSQLAFAIANTVLDANNGVKRGQIGILTSCDAWEGQVNSLLRSAFRVVGLTKAGMLTSNTSVRHPYAAVFYGMNSVNEVGRHVIEILEHNLTSSNRAIISCRLVRTDSGVAIQGATSVNALYRSSPTSLQVADILVNENGDVGIGTTNPTYKLDVAGSMKLTNGNDSKTIYGPNTSWSSYLSVGSGTTAISTTTAQCLSTNGNLHLDCGTDKLMYLNFYSNKNIVTNTNVSMSIGLASFPYLYRLWVEASDDSPQGTCGLYYPSGLGVASVLDIRSNVGGTRALRCKILTSGNIQNTNNSYGALSDIKFKTDIVDAKSQLEDIKNIRIVNFKMKNGDTKHIGVIAQEIEQVCPYLVEDIPETDSSGNEIGTYKTVKYSILYMKNIKATQELIEKVETLEDKVETLEKENEELKSRLERLEKILLSN